MLNFPRDWKAFLSAGLVALAVGLIVWKIFGGGEKITLVGENVPLREILRSLEKQTRLPSLTNLDPETPVTIHVRKVPLQEALETLSAETEAACVPVWLVAPSKAEAKAAMPDLVARNAKDWKSFYAPLPPWFESPVPNPRATEWQVEAVDGATNLQAYLRQAAQKTGFLLAAPLDWNPEVAAPSSGSLKNAVSQLAKRSGGTSQQAIFLLGGRMGGNWEGRAARVSGSTTGDSSGASAEGRRGEGERRAMVQNEQWLRERLDQALAGMPPAEAQEIREANEAVFVAIKAVQEAPEEERAAKMRELFNDPGMQSAMEQRAARQDARRSPEKRQKRYERYAQRRAEAKAAAQQQQGSSQ